MRLGAKEAALLGLALAATTAHGQFFRTYLSSTGSDSNPCTLAAPCRLLPAALNAVGPDGEVWMLDSANYNTGTVTIGKSVSILAAPGAIGSLVSPGNGSPALDIATPNLTVSLRNLTLGPLPGAPGASTGVRITAPSVLAITSSTFAGFSGAGLQASDGRVTVGRSTFRSNPGNAIHASGQGGIVVTDSRFFLNGIAVLSEGIGNDSMLASVTVRQCVLSGNVHGVRSQSTTGNSTIHLDRTVVEGSEGHAISAQSTEVLAQFRKATVTMRGSTIVRNAFAYVLPLSFQAAWTYAYLESYGDNLIDGNPQKLGDIKTLLFTR